MSINRILKLCLFMYVKTIKQFFKSDKKLNGSYLQKKWGGFNFFYASKANIYQTPKLFYV